MQIIANILTELWVMYEGSAFHSCEASTYQTWKLVVNMWISYLIWVPPHFSSSLVIFKYQSFNRNLLHAPPHHLSKHLPSITPSTTSSSAFDVWRPSSWNPEKMHINNQCSCKSYIGIPGFSGGYSIDVKAHKDDYTVFLKIFLGPQYYLLTFSLCIFKALTNSNEELGVGQ